ncbi:MAG TPA: FAD-binding oxidoreductase [Pirellulaceae bacterium]|jgi:glycolate oxidase FAD binding subunit|nr:FAD-binding oxidoreductase [Pirellulaceae bacterium]
MTGAEEGGRLVAPTTAEEARQIVQEAADRREAIYPVGGGLALDELLPKPRPGIDLSLAGLDRIVEFSPRDLTITVDAGTSLAKLAETVDEAGLLFPFASKFDRQSNIGEEIDRRSTIGGLLATAWNGPRRTGWGNLRDYFIGVRAIDGRGVLFKSGGKVVKNVAGYDFCKLLVGSRGTLGVITEVTLRLKPKPEARWLATIHPAEGQSLAKLVEQTNQPAIPYSVYEVAVAEALPFPEQLELDDAFVRCGWEGPREEIDVAKAEIDALVRAGRFRLEESDETTKGFESVHLLGRDAPTAALYLRIQAPPTTLLQALSSASLAGFSPEGGLLIFAPRSGHARLFVPPIEDREAASKALAALREEIGGEGYVTVLRDRLGIAPTRELRFGRTTSPQFLMDRVKAAMDPCGILNPGRYVFADAMGDSADVA